MRRILLFAALLLTAQPALAFTPDQRREIVQIIRDALKADPTILREAIVSLQADEQARDQADMKSRLAASQHALTATFGDPVAGNPNGDVTLVEFYDPRCPYCRKMLPAIQALLQKDPKLRLVYKDIPVLGPASVMETRAILAAENQGGYAKMQSALMADPAAPSDAMIADVARGLGLDPAKLAADMNSPAISHQIDTNLGLAHALKVDGTPVWIVGDTVIPGAVDEDALAAAIASARRKG